MVENEHLFHDIVEPFDGAYFVDAERRITFWNKSAEHLTGNKSKEVVGSLCHDNILSHVDEQGTHLCGRAAQRRRSPTACKLRRRPDKESAAAFGAGAHCACEGQGQAHHRRHREILLDTGCSGGASVSLKLYGGPSGTVDGPGELPLRRGAKLEEQGRASPSASGRALRDLDGRFDRLAEINAVWRDVGDGIPRMVGDMFGDKHAAASRPGGGTLGRRHAPSGHLVNVDQEASRWRTASRRLVATDCAGESGGALRSRSEWARRWPRPATSRRNAP